MMDRREVKNVVASVRQKLKNWADAPNAVFALVLPRRATSGNEFRTTCDIDLLGTRPADHAAIREARTAVCVIEVPRDVLAFDPATIRMNEIRHEQGYGDGQSTILLFFVAGRAPPMCGIGFAKSVSTTVKRTRRGW